VPRSPFLHLAPPAAALGLAATRWWQQGATDLYTAVHKRFYVPDPDFGWRVSGARPFWIGLELLGILAAVVAGFAVCAWWVRARERRRGVPMRRLRGLGWAAACVPLAVPAWALASGGRPGGGRDQLPTGAVAVPGDGIEGGLDAPAGAWRVVPREGSAVTARLAAGGETFDARFAGGLRGRLTFDPHDLSRPATASVAVDAGSVDTGIALRTRHARDDYLQVGEYPRIGLDLVRLAAARSDGPDRIAFRGAAVVHLIGRDQPVAIAGTVRLIDAAGARRLGVDRPALLVSADLTLHVRDTALAPDAGDFDRDPIPVHASLLLVPDRPTSRGVP
jgi:polyisoprenoid-binding protein YceI